METVSEQQGERRRSSAWGRVLRERPPRPTSLGGFVALAIAIGLGLLILIPALILGTVVLGAVAAVAGVRRLVGAVVGDRRVGGGDARRNVRVIVRDDAA